MDIEAGIGIARDRDCDIGIALPLDTVPLPQRGHLTSMVLHGLRRTAEAIVRGEAMPVMIIAFFLNETVHMFYKSTCSTRASQDQTATRSRAVGQGPPAVTPLRCAGHGDHEHDRVLLSPPGPSKSVHALPVEIVKM